MKYDPQYHNRRSNRMKGYDYTQAGAYYVTICTWDRECMFGQIENGEMILNKQGKIAYDEWVETFEMRKNTELDVFVIMPNHIHGIIVITHHDNTRRGVLHTPNNQIIDHLLHTPIDQNTTQTLHTPNNQITDHLSHTPNEQNNEQNHNMENTQGVCNTQGACNTPLRSPSETVGAIVRGFKSSVTSKINLLNHCKGFSVWQRNFHDHIIRNHNDYIRISNYIQNNQATWIEDKFYRE